MTGVEREADRRQVAALARRLSPDERSDLRRFSLVQANVQKYQQQARKQSRQLHPIDHTSDKQMEQLAVERARHMRLTGCADR